MKFIETRVFNVFFAEILASVVVITPLMIIKNIWPEAIKFTAEISFGSIMILILLFWLVFMEVIKAVDSDRERKRLDGN